MSIIDGYQTTMKIREMFDQVGLRREHQPKIVAVTCLTEKEFVKKAYKSGIDQIIPKPVPIEQFGKML